MNAVLAWLAPWRTAATAPSAEERIAFATQFQLTWWRFRKHRVAVWSGIIVILFYIAAIFADTIAYTDPQATDSRRSYIPPQAIHLLDDDGSLRPWVHGLKGKRDLKTFKIVYTVDPDSKLYLRFFAEGYPYHLFGLIPSTTHLFGVANGKA
jgi:peptide/nickel transport system permease protein